MSIKKFLAAAVLICFSTIAAAAGLQLPNGEQQFFDANGDPLTAGKVFMYVPNTSTPKNTWQDPNLTALNTNPIILDSAGRARIWAEPGAHFRQVVQDQDNNLIWDQPSFLGGTLVGPSTTTINELASWGDTTGTLLRQGAATLTDNKTTGITTDSAALEVKSQGGVDANAFYIWTCTIGTCNNPASDGNYDALRGVTVAPLGQTVDLVTGVAGYIINSQTRPDPPGSFPVSAALSGVAIGDADGSGTWGINTIVTDNRGQQVSSHGPRFIVGGEFDTQATSPNTSVFGVFVGGTSLVQPVSAVGYSCLYLDGMANAGSVAKWQECITSQHGAATTFAHIGAMAATGTSISSQNLDFYYIDGAGDDQHTSLSQTPGGLSLTTTGVPGSASIVIPGGAVFNVGDLGGYQINTRAIAVASGTVVSLASDLGWTGGVNVGTTTGKLSLIGTTIDVLNGASMNFSGGFIELAGAAAPSAPGAGWRLYVDSGDLFRLKAIASTGTVVTLGTP